MARDILELADAVDRYGADLAAWPDPALAAEARRAALADRAFRARLDREADLEAGLAQLRDALDAGDCRLRRRGAGRGSGACGAAAPRPMPGAGRWPRLPWWSRRRWGRSPT